MPPLPPGNDVTEDAWLLIAFRFLALCSRSEYNNYTVKFHPFLNEILTILMCFGISAIGKPTSCHEYRQLFPKNPHKV
jgi:hypothetical protein